MAALLFAGSSEGICLVIPRRDLVLVLATTKAPVKTGFSPYQGSVISPNYTFLREIYNGSAFR